MGKPISRRRFVTGLASAAALIAAGGLAGCDAEGKLSQVSGVPLQKREITDHAGRTLSIPAVANLERICGTSALAQLFIFTLNPDLLAVVNGRFTDEQLKYLPAGLGEKESIGSITDGTFNRESLLLEDVQVVFSISAVELTDANISDAEDLQKQTGVPVVLIDGSMDKISEAYRFLGECIGQEERAEELASYCERVFADVDKAVGGIPEGEQTTFYYAEGTEGLQSEPRRSQHTVAFERAGAYNILDEEEIEEMGMVDISLETILSADPDVIFAWSFDTRGGADRAIREMASWSNLSAVKAGRVYTMPDMPFSWVDRPAAVNRFLGIQWVANLLYPQKYDIDIVKVAKEFYQLFYSVGVTDEEIIGWLGNSYQG